MSDFDHSTRRYKFDFYLPEFRLVIEYNGCQHYRPVQFCGASVGKAEENFILQQVRDQHKRYFCIENNINLFEIDGRIYTRQKLIEFVAEIAGRLKQEKSIVEILQELEEIQAVEERNIENKKQDRKKVRPNANNRNK